MPEVTVGPRGRKPSHGKCATPGCGHVGRVVKGLCRPCYRKHWLANCWRGIKLPRVTDPGPTDAEPGTRRKLAVIELRYRRGLPLWHPLDAL